MGLKEDLDRQLDNPRMTFLDRFNSYAERLVKKHNLEAKPRNFCEYAEELTNLGIEGNSHFQLYNLYRDIIKYKGLWNVEWEPIRVLEQITEESGYEYKPMQEFFGTNDLNAVARALISQYETQDDFGEFYFEIKRPDIFLIGYKLKRGMDL